MDSQSPKETQPSNNERLDQSSLQELIEMLKNLSHYSKGSWTKKEALLWNRYVNLCRDSELKELASKGEAPKKAKTLVRMTWVTRCSDTGDLVEKPMPPEASLVAVPCLSVFRNGSFVIEEGMRGYLEDHPLLSRGGDDLSNQHEQVRVLRALDAVSALEVELEVGHLGLHHLSEVLTVYGGKENRYAELGSAACWLRLLLDPEYRESGSKGDLKWLVTGRNRDRFWRLLDAAMLLGEAVERHRILDELDGEEALRRTVTSPRGKHTGEVGDAMERMIEAYILDKGSPPTASRLFHWLGAERSSSDGDPIRVSHRLWTDAMAKVSWLTFKQHVNDAKKRMKRIK